MKKTQIRIAAATAAASTNKTSRKGTGTPSRTAEAAAPETETAVEEIAPEAETVVNIDYSIAPPGENAKQKKIRLKKLKEASQKALELKENEGKTETDGAEAVAALPAESTEAAPAAEAAPAPKASPIGLLSGGVSRLAQMIEAGMVVAHNRKGSPRVYGPVTEGVWKNKPGIEVTVGYTKTKKPIRQSYWNHVLDQYLKVDATVVAPATEGAEAVADLAPATEPAPAEVPVTEVTEVPTETVTA